MGPATSSCSIIAGFDVDPGDNDPDTPQQISAWTNSKQFLLNGTSNGTWLTVKGLSKPTTRGWHTSYNAVADLRFSSPGQFYIWVLNAGASCSVNVHLRLSTRLSVASSPEPTLTLAINTAAAYHDYGTVVALHPTKAWMAAAAAGNELCTGAFPFVYSPSPGLDFQGFKLEPGKYIIDIVANDVGGAGASTDIPTLAHITTLGEPHTSTNTLIHGNGRAASADTTSFVSRLLVVVGAAAFYYVTLGAVGTFVPAALSVQISCIRYGSAVPRILV